jgi:hypothetical protein
VPIHTVITYMPTGQGATGAPHGSGQGGQGARPRRDAAWAKAALASSSRVRRAGDGGGRGHGGVRGSGGGEHGACGRGVGGEAGEELADIGIDASSAGTADEAACADCVEGDAPRGGSRQWSRGSGEAIPRRLKTRTLLFESRFEGGNLARVRQVGEAGNFFFVARVFFPSGQR